MNHMIRQVTQMEAQLVQGTKLGSNWQCAALPNAASVRRTSSINILINCRFANSWKPSAGKVNLRQIFLVAIETCNLQMQAKLVKNFLRSSYSVYS